MAIAGLLAVSLVRAAEPAGDPVANGVFLVAQPGLVDPNFRESVVLITLPGPGMGPLGVIVNRPAGRTLGELVPAEAAGPGAGHPVHEGGPVSRNRLLFVFRQSTAPAGALQVLEDTWLSDRADLLRERLAAPDARQTVRVYAGYAGWAPGQLQAEIARGGWFVVRADPNVIFSSDPAAVWRTLIGRAGERRTAVEHGPSTVAVRLPTGL